MPRVRFWTLAVIAYTFVIAYYSLVEESLLRSTPVVGPLQGVWDGFFTHLVAYTVLGMLWRASGRGKTGSLAASIVTGIAIELMQAATPYRSPSISDGLANSLGSIIGVLIAPRAFTSRASSQTPPERG